MNSAGETATAAPPVSPASARGTLARLIGRLDRVGLVIVVLAVAALAVEPFVTFRANRIVSGKGVGLMSALPPALAWPAAGLILAAAVLAAWRSRPVVRLLAGAAMLIVLAALVGVTPAHLVAANAPLARVSPAAGFWLLSFAFAILLTDAIAKLSPGPALRLAALAAAAMVVAVILGSGLWNGLSVMKEYASHADSFWREAAQHVALAFGSLVAAVVVGVPLGLACHRSTVLRGVTLPVLNIIQTIPSIAMYGLMMVPLGALAAALPVLGSLGIRGIGTAPAAIALFLYSLLPVVANVVVGLEQVDRQVVDAAAGMGMTPRQRLARVELPLALPVILTGIRIVLVQNIGLVTIAALIGGGGFGTFVFQGIGQAATDLVLLGAVPTIALAFAAAIILDALIDALRGRHA